MPPPGGFFAVRRLSNRRGVGPTRRPEKTVDGKPDRRPKARDRAKRTPTWAKEKRPALLRDRFEIGRAIMSSR